MFCLCFEKTFFYPILFLTIGERRKSERVNVSCNTSLYIYLDRCQVEDRRRTLFLNIWLTLNRARLYSPGGEMTAALADTQSNRLGTDWAWASPPGGHELTERTVLFAFVSI